MEGQERFMNFNDIIKASVWENFTSDISLEKMCIVLGITALLGIYIFIVYRVAVNNEFYSKDFNRTLVLMAVVTAGIVLAIQSNLVISLGMVGALSIVRYRTAIKSPLDLFFLFWSISIGIICGAGLYILAGMMSLFITVVILLVSKLESPIRLSLLVVSCDSLSAAEQALELVKARSSYCRIKNKTVSSERVEVIVEFKTKKEKALEKALSECSGVNKFSFINYDRENRI